MKPTLLLALTTALLTACASEPDSRTRTRAAASEPSRAQQHRESAADDQEEGSRPPRIGMTKDQVINMYGEPTNVSSSGSRGEVWHYVFNNFDGRAFIPIYGGYQQAFKRRNSGTIMFGRDGRVQDFNWNETNPRGASIWR